ncbi:MAG: MFS transporter [Pseudomonadota bacterium]
MHQRFPSVAAKSGLSLCVLIAALGTSSASVTLPAVVDAFDASFQQVQWVVLAYLVAVTVLVLAAGRLGDLFGRKRLLGTGLALFGAASLACTLAPSLMALVAARAVQGMGAAILMPLAMTLLAEGATAGKTGSAMGLQASVSAAGTALGPALGGALLTLFGWPAVFFINVPLVALAWLLLRATIPADAQPLKWQRPARPGAASPATQKASAPALLMASMPGFAMNAVASAIVMATLVVGPFYLDAGLQLDAGVIGLAMSAGPIAVAITGLPAGRAVDRFGARPCRTAGLAGMAVGCLLMVLLPPWLGLGAYIFSLVIITSAYALFQGANNTVVMNAAAPLRRALVAAQLNLSRNVGLIAGTALMGSVYAMGAARLGGPETGLQLSFMLAFALAGVCLWLARPGEHLPVALR